MRKRLALGRSSSVPSQARSGFFPSTSAQAAAGQYGQMFGGVPAPRAGYYVYGVLTTARVRSVQTR